MDRGTVDVYEQQANEWLRRRQPRALARAETFGARVGGRWERPVVDLGCGPGWYTTALGAPAVALDAAGAMLDLVAGHAPAALRVQADLEALPFQSTALGGAFAVASYVHVARHRMPLALADLHRSLEVGAPVELLVFGGDQDHGALDGDDFPGRNFSLWPADELADTVIGAGFAVDEVTERAGGDGRSGIVVAATRLRTLADTVAPAMRMLVCGLNPSIYSADAGVGYARPGNRFWPALRAAGLTTVDRDARRLLTDDGIGMTDLVKRATVGAAELTATEYRDGLARVERLATRTRPGVVCFVGLAGWRAAVDRRALAGAQDRRIGGARVYIMPSTSGLNAHSRPADSANHLRAAAALAPSGS